MSDLILRTNVVNKPTPIWLMWVDGQLTLPELEAIEASFTDSFIDAVANMTWTVLRFRKAVGTRPGSMVGDRKYVIQLNASASVLSCNFDLDTQTANSLRDYLTKLQASRLTNENTT